MRHQNSVQLFLNFVLYYFMNFNCIMFCVIEINFNKNNLIIGEIKNLNK